MQLVARRFSDVSIGEILPPIEMEISLTALVMYAAATWDFHRYHYDRAYIVRLGMPAPFMDGQMAGALLARQLMQWAGPNAFITRLSYRLRGSMVFEGDRIRITGRVVETDNAQARALVRCELDIIKVEGTPVVQQATAMVEFMRG